MQKYQTIDHIELPSALHANWQNTLNLLAEALEVPAALIMRVHAKEIEVYVRSESPGNVYEEGEKADLDTGLYCETVMDTQQELLVPNALTDSVWDHNPDIELDMISYCGFPISWPSGEVFGTICILDIKGNKYSKLYRKILEQFRDTVQGGLTALYDHEALKKAHAELEKITETLDVKITERTAHLEQEILDHKKTEDALVRFKDEAEQANAALGKALDSEKKYSALQQQFVSLVSHEFRTPLSIIDGSAQRMLRRCNKVSPEELKTRTSTIRSAVNRMTGLMDKTLYLSRLDASEIKFSPENTNLKGLIRDVCEAQMEFSPDHELSLDVESLPDQLTVDPALMDQVFSNLISNAVKYCPGGGRIEVIGKQENDTVKIGVRDQGLGVPEDDLSKMFQRFFRAKTTVGIPGTGIGLSLCKAFMEMHGGEISVDSIEGEGATFMVSLPVCVESQ